MKITVAIPNRELKDAMWFTKARGEEEAVVRAVVAFNRRMRMAELTRYSGTCKNLIAPEELQAARREG